SSSVVDMDIDIEETVDRLVSEEKPSPGSVSVKFNLNIAKKSYRKRSREEGKVLGNYEISRLREEARREDLKKREMKKVEEFKEAVEFELSRFEGVKLTEKEEAEFR